MPEGRSFPTGSSFWVLTKRLILCHAFIICFELSLSRYCWGEKVFTNLLS
jgi:hypothetical protein